MQQNIVNENKYTGFGTKKTYSSITKTDKDGASERNAALEKSIEVFGNFGKAFGKMFVLIIAGIFTVFPFIWMILSALKTKAEVMDVSKLLPAKAQWGNFVSIFTASPMVKYIGNSLFVSIAVVAIQIVTGAMLAYAMVFMSFRGRKGLFAIVMGTYMLPAAATYIPSYIILAKLGLLNSYTGLIISDTINIFGIFLLRQAFMQVPKPLIEAAKMDGAGHVKILWKVVMPMTKSSFITFGLMSFITMYNSYMWPSLITNDKNISLVSQGLRSFFIEGGAYGTEWPKVMAASAVIVVPLLIMFAFTQKWFINGIGGEVSKDKWASVNIMQDCENCTAMNQSVALVVSMQYKMENFEEDYCEKEIIMYGVDDEYDGLDFFQDVERVLNQQQKRQEIQRVTDL